MLRRHHQLRMQIHQLLDVVLFCAALWAAHRFRAAEFFIVKLNASDIRPFDEYLTLYLAVIPLVLLVLPIQGFYNRSMFGSRREMWWKLLKSCTIVTVGTILIAFIMREHPARGVIILFGMMSFGFVAVKEELFRIGMKSTLLQSQFRRRLILVGNKTEINRFKREVRDGVGMEGIEWAAELDFGPDCIPSLVQLLHEHSANGVVVLGQHALFDQIEKVIQAAELEGVEAWLIANFFKTQNSMTSFDELHGHPVMVFRTAPEVSWEAIAKQMIDFAGALALLLAVSPILLICALLVKFSSPGPILFRQQRCGLNGRPFTMLKFRSMVSDAEQRKHEFERLNEMTGPVFKLSNDPRVTPVGRFLRRWSLDEWPQLFNILKGDMSLVGPRPLPVDEVRRFDDLAHRRRLSVKPGLTCTWQVSGRNNVQNFKEWVRMDLEYIDNWSLWLDLKILWRTIPAVVSGAGAK